jgi:uncharacterized short protein YbdD (DUF466 family)
MKERNALQDFFATAARQTARTARLMCGVPDYETYVAHMRRKHPDRAPLGYLEFFRSQQEARYGNGRARCC